MKSFSEADIEKYLKYTDENVLPLEEQLGRCFMCGVSLSEVELPEGPEKKVVCLKDRDHFIELFEELEHENSGATYEPEFLKEDESGLIPGEVILLYWCNDKTTDKKFPLYFKNNYAVDAPKSVEKLLDKGFLEYGNYHEQLNALTIPKLKEILKSHKVKSKGKKAELVQRILDNEIKESNIPKSYRLTDKGRQIVEYSEHIILAHKDKYFPVCMVYMAVRYREEFPYPTRYEDLKLGVLDTKIEEYTENNMIFELEQCLNVKGKHLENYNKDYDQSLVYALLLTLISLYDTTRRVRFGVKRIDYNDIDRLITKGSIDKKQFNYLFDQALVLFNFDGYDLDLIDSDEIKYIREAIYNIDYINTQKYIEKYISAKFFIEYGSDNHYMFISDIEKY
ncbi:SAP domain-containing protein [Oceanobacillus luteolus]|uniref:SAP domain-containing protein n=1 Tax=Oceanobacillus luteolus TaxID=1274358 RepID=A0ABW4HSQ8_9BACI